MIILQARRPVSGQPVTAFGDPDVPVILRDGVLLDVDLDRFLLDLRVSGVRSRHSLRAYGYDIMTWARFLDEVRGTSLWRASSADVAAYHRARRHGAASARISAQSWNRAVAALDRLYLWAVEQELAAASPFSYRQALRHTTRGRRALVAVRNTSYERAAERTEVCPVTLEDYVRFRDLGLRGLTSGGERRAGARDRNGMRNALFADLLVTTGLRLEEASSLLAIEIEAALAGCVGSDAQQIPFRLAACLTKGDRGRTIRVPRRLLHALRSYIGIERARAIEKFKARQGWRSLSDAILCRPGSRAGQLQTRIDADAPWVPMSLDRLSPDERRRLLLTDDAGVPQASAALWLTETGQPVVPNSWEVAFARAARRCHAAGTLVSISPHQLRHTFAGQMLALLMRERGSGTAGDAHDAGGSYRLMLDEALQEVRRLLGHASLATTYRYANRLPCNNGTADAAVEELLRALEPLPPGGTA